MTTRTPARASLHFLLLLFVLHGIVPALVLASSSQAWVLRNRGDFQDAKLDGVALGSDGSLRLSAKVSRLLDSAQPNMWCLARDSRGRIYAGGGNEGKVFRIDPSSGKSETVFDADELEVHALALDSRGALYVGTSPRGAVYKVDESGMRTLIFDPEETYIWALAFDPRDRLFVATGQKGRVYRIDDLGPNAKGKTVLDGREDHIRSMALAPDGSIYAGSDQNGILYRIRPDGTNTVIYDSPMREISALLVVGDQIYMAALAPAPGQHPPAPGGAENVTRIRVTADDSGGDQDQTPGGEEEPQPQPPPRPPARPQPRRESYYGAVFKVSPDGYARKLWESRESLPLSLAPWSDHAVLVGTGDEGRVLLVDDTGDVTDFVDVEAQQVNALLQEQEGRRGVLAAASNIGQVVRIDPAASDRGTVTARAQDAGYTASWGALSWVADQPKGSAIAFRVRTGNTENPDDSWSDWSPEYTGAGNAPIERPRARYLQWQAILKSERGGVSPVLRSVQINYLQDNLPPEITGIEVMPPGVVLTGSAGATGDQPDLTAGARRAQNLPRRSFDRGKRAVAWKVEDANNDTLRYDVFFKAEDETLWKPLIRGSDDEFYSWDATTMPDGVYRIKVTASDAPSNPAASVLEGSRISLAFDVDNTPPIVSQPQAKLQSRVAEVTVTVTDTFSVVGDVAFSLDAGDWVPVLPEDRIADSTKETYRFRTPDLEPGEHTVTVKARDRAGNTGANRLVIRVEK
ncbi:MAG TPA: hypothetical protein VFE84_00795 [Patescibacteria group bacterium]|nr:hypothetical protein [Patescibacteria group bacterium]